MSKPKKKHPGNKILRTKDNPTRTVRTPGNREKLLKKLEEGFSIAGAASAVGLGRMSLYEWMKDDETLRTDVEEKIKGPGTDRLIDVGMDHATNGVEEPVIFQGAIQYVMVPRVEEEEDEKTGEIRRVVKYDFKLDKAGNPIPLTIRTFDHGLLSRMIALRRPAPVGGLGDAIISLADELREARMRAGVTG